MAEIIDCIADETALQILRFGIETEKDWEKHKPDILRKIREKLL